MLDYDLEAYYFLPDHEERPSKPVGIPLKLSHKIFLGIPSIKNLFGNPKDDQMTTILKLRGSLKDENHLETTIYRVALDILIDYCTIASTNKANNFKDYHQKIIMIINENDYPFLNYIALEYLILCHNLDGNIKHKKFYDLFITVLSFFLISISTLYLKKNIARNIKDYALEKFDLNERTKQSSIQILNRAMKMISLKSESIFYFITALKSLRFLKNTTKFKYNLTKIAVKFCFVKISQLSINEKFAVSINRKQAFNELEVPENINEATVYMTISLESYLFGHLSARANINQRANSNEDVYELYIAYLLYFCLQNNINNLFLNVMDVSFKVNSRFTIETCSLCYLSHDPYDSKGLNFLENVCENKESLDNMCILIKHLVYQSYDYQHFMSIFEKINTMLDNVHQTALLSYIWMLRGIMHLKVFGYSESSITETRKYFVTSLEIDQKNDLAHYHLARIDSICLKTQSASHHLDNIRFLNNEPVGYFTVLLFTTSKNYVDALSIIENNNYENTYRILIAALKINHILNRKWSVKLVSKKLIQLVDKKLKSRSFETFTITGDNMIDQRQLDDITIPKNKMPNFDNKMSLSMQSFDIRDSDENMSDTTIEQYYDLAKTFLEINSINYASFCIKRISKIKSNSPELLFLNGLIAKVKTENQKAVSLFEKYLQIAPRCILTMYHLADLYISNEKYEIAKDFLEEAFQIENTDPNISKKLAFVHLKLGNIAKSKIFNSLNAKLSNNSPILDFKTTDLMIF